MIKLKFVFGFVFFLTLTAQASFSSSNFLGLYFTDNANFEKDQKDADFYLNLSTVNTISNEEWKWRFRLGYFDYAKENQNDLLSGQVSGHYMLVPGARSTEAYLKLLFQNYLASQVSGSTDASYNYSGFELGTEHNFELKNEASFKLHPYYQQRTYSNLNQRKDQQLGGILTFDKDWNKKTYGFAEGELGFLSSSLSEYSKNFLVISVGGDHKLDGDWALEGSLSLQSATYTSRTTTQVIAGTTRKKSNISTETVPESTSNLTLNFSGLRQITEEFKFRAGVTLINQNSRSGDETYAANIIYGQLNYNF